MTKYARDEFDRVPETSTRQGVHRAVTESRRGLRLGSILAVGTAALAVGLVAFLLLPKLGFSSAGETTAVATGQGGSSAAASPAPTESTPAPSSAASVSAASVSPEAGATPSASATPSAAATPSASATASPSLAAAIDKTQPVGVFNGTTTAGLATRVGGTVSTAGWTIGTLGNWGGAPQTRSVIFYDGAEQKGNAEALGKLLGIPTVVDSPDFQLPLVVVLAPGFR